MGSCVSNHQQLINEINKPANRQFILDHLNINLSKNDELLLEDNDESMGAGGRGGNCGNSVTPQPLATTPAMSSTKDLVYPLSVYCSKCKCTCQPNYATNASTSLNTNHNNTNTNECSIVNEATEASNKIDMHRLMYDELVFKIIAVDSSGNGVCVGGSGGGCGGGPENQQHKGAKKISFLVNPAGAVVAASAADNEFHFLSPKCEDEQSQQQQQQHLNINANNSCGETKANALSRGNVYEARIG